MKIKHTTINSHVHLWWNNGKDYECLVCGLNGKRVGQSNYLHIDGGVEDIIIQNCLEEVPLLVEVVKLTRLVAPFDNVIVGKDYEVIEAPVNSSPWEGVWIKGENGRPYKLNPEEYNIIL
jgi:hypothetical protein